MLAQQNFIRQTEGDDMPIDVEPFSSALGASVTGIDLSAPIDADDFRDIHAAWLEHLVLVFPGQNFSDTDQVRFTEMFGDLPDKPVRSRGTKSAKQLHKSVMLVTNIREDGKVIGSLPDGEMHFHTDGAYETDPYRYTLLYAIEVPKTGGNTLFANMYTAYDTLDDDLKRRLAGVDAEHGFYTGVDVSDDMKSALGLGDYQSTARHPVFCAHEETGRTALYVNRLLTQCIADAADRESREILSRLFDHSERSEFVYEHIWTAGDFVMWDNRCTNHARTDFSAGERRLLRRTTVQGVAPAAAVISA